MKLEKREGVHGTSDKLGTMLIGAIVFGEVFDLSFVMNYFGWFFLTFCIYFSERGLFRAFMNNKWIFEIIADSSVKTEGHIRSWMGKNKRDELSHDKREELIYVLMIIPFVLLQLPLLFLVVGSIQYLFMFQLRVVEIFNSPVESPSALFKIAETIDLWFVLMFFGHEVFNFFKSYKVKFGNLVTS